jgi:hypothetical protein
VRATSYKLLLISFVVFKFQLTRSLIAVRMLHDDGYRNLAWLAGGFSKCADGDFAGVEGESKLQYATIGGASYIFLQILLFLGVVK